MGLVEESERDGAKKIKQDSPKSSKSTKNESN